MYAVKYERNKMESGTKDSSWNYPLSIDNIKTHKGCHVGARALQRLSKTLGVSNVNLSMDEYCTQLDLAYKTYHQIKIDHANIRTTYI